MSWVKRFAHIADSCLKYLNTLTLIIAALVILTVMSLILYEVISRELFDSPTTWVMEMTTYALVYIIFLPLGYTQQLQQHIKVDALTSRLPVKMRNRLGIVTSALSLFLFIILTWGTLQYALDRSGDRSGTNLDIPLWPILVVIPVGMMMISLQLGITFIRHIAEELFPGHQDNS